MGSNAFLSSITILVVEDDQHFRKIVRSLLMSFGVAKVYEASDGAQGLELLNQFRPDVLLLDWEMPILDGAEMTRLIRKPNTSPHATVPIIMMTGFTQRHRIAEAIRLGVNEILSKPFSAKSLNQRLEMTLRHPRPFVQRGGYFGPLPRDARTIGASLLPPVDVTVN